MDNSLKGFTFGLLVAAIIAAGVIALNAYLKEDANVLRIEGADGRIEIRSIPKGD